MTGQTANQIAEAMYGPGISIPGKIPRWLATEIEVQSQGVAFNRFVYDEISDVLYCSVGEPAESDESIATPMGHNIRRRNGAVIGMTIVNAEWIARRALGLGPSWKERYGG